MKGLPSLDTSFRLPRGVFTISIDLELAWGLCDVPLTAAHHELIGRERAVVERLLALFEHFRLRATWAIVAHLLLERWERDGAGRPHPGFPRPVTLGAERDHFFQLPAERHAAWWGGDLVTAIRAARPAHEIGSHSFSHLLYDEGRANPAAVAADLDAARAIHDRRGLPFDSFVFPRNVIGFKPLLRRAGARVYRDVTPRWYAGLRPRPLLRAARLASYLVSSSPPTVRPRLDGGLVALGDSLLLLGRDGARALVPGAALTRLGRRGLERAAARREVFHLWFHPANLAAGGERPFAVLAAILERAARLIDDGRLENRVMGDFAALAAGADDAAEEAE